MRWAAVRAMRGLETRGETRVVRVTIEDSRRGSRVIEMRAEQTERGWGRWLVRENGELVGMRRLGAGVVGRLIARSLA